MTSELRTLLDTQRERTREVEHVCGSIIPWVFHRAGERIRDFRRVWATACEQLDAPGACRTIFGHGDTGTSSSAASRARLPWA
jgi:hypothetical protein